MMIRKANIPLKKFLRRIHRRMLSLTSKPCNKTEISEDIAKIRNIGILAHIDAGITITSAAVTFYWLKHRLNLIDTPGHIDFTMEVEQALHVIDGAVVILDSSAGVEAQTLTVWRQADCYGIPRIVYANKMDRNDGDIKLCESTLISKLGACPLQLQVPLRDDKNKLVGIVDLVQKEKCVWKGNRGEVCERIKLTKSDGVLYDKTMTARAELVDRLTDLDDILADTVINLDSIDNIESKDLNNAIRRVTLMQKAVPLICGSSYKNIGVQPLMDAIVNFLPSPLECSNQRLLSSCFKDNLSSKVFKIIHDKQRGPVTFLRIYSGSLIKGQKIYSMNQKKSEQINRLMVALADDYEEVKEIHAGNVVAVSGLKNVMTGDLITNSNSSMNSAKNYLVTEKKLTDEEANNLLGVGVTVPDPVFFCAIEPSSLKFQAPLEAALNELQREDPSLKVIFDTDTGQTILGGMGELHLEIIKQRIESEYKVEVDLGPLQIAYKEQLDNSPTKYTHELKHVVGNSHHFVKITLSATTRVEKENEKRELLTLDRSPENVANVTAVSPRRLLLIKQGITSGISHGPVLSSPVIDITFKLHWLEVGKGTSEPMLIAAVSQCVQKIFEIGGTVLLEPIMSLEIVCNEESLSAIMSDLSSRRAAVENIGMRGNSKVVSALVPLSELLGYSKDLRIITSGTGSFTMEFCKYQQVSQYQLDKIVQQLGGI
ncbi:mitochondrial ribosome recycling factor 2 isoform X2 [Lycorma delicatula]|uniref:mitochondrial ribosome recycling factor 2 isoform X2 n=1 Tax=Lycorma delicatula TaxID=130591 RepID=UPI003F514D2C